VSAPAVEFNDDHLITIIDLVKGEIRQMHEMEMRGGRPSMGEMSKVTNVGAIAEYLLLQRADERKRAAEAKAAQGAKEKKSEKK